VKLVKKLLLIAVAVCFVASASYAYEMSYGWEDCGTVLGMYPEGTGVIPTNVTAPDPVYAGLRSLKVEDNHPSGTPQAYVAYIYGLVDGDSVYVEFARYDDTPGVAPSCRIWAHWNDSYPPDINAYSGSAGGNSDYGPGLGWDIASWYWIVADGHTGIVIECRTYSNPGDIVYLDDLYVYAPSRIGVCIHVPEAGPSATENSTWGGIKRLYH
jgi:hypothetical protein